MKGKDKEWAERGQIFKEKKGGRKKRERKREEKEKEKEIRSGYFEDYIPLDVGWAVWGASPHEVIYTSIKYFSTNIFIINIYLHREEQERVGEKRKSKSEKKKEGKKNEKRGPNSTRN